jgi:magnesium and cobalt exporter, CNNM family
MGVIELAVMLAMIAFNGVFAAYEIALAAVAVARLQILKHENRRGADSALYMKENMEGSLAGIQIGITLFGAIAAATGGAGAEEVIGPWLRLSLGLPKTLAEVAAVAIVVIPLTAFTITFGELVPKVFALRNKEWVCLFLSPAMYWFTVSVWPAVWFFETVVSAIADWGERRFRRFSGTAQPEAMELQELHASVALARTSRLIGHREERIILGAARLSSRFIREIMLDAENIDMLAVSDSTADCLIKAHLDMHTRFPVSERAGDPQAITGYVNFKDIVAHMRLSPHDPSLRAILRAIPSFRDDTPISAVLENLMRERTHIALVRDARGRVLGMITLEDIIEELVGDIQDEYDLLPVHIAASGEGWVAGGGVSLTRLREVTGIDLSTDPPPTQVHNLNGWIAAHLGRAVTGGEILERKSARIVVRKVRRQQVLEAQIGPMR